MADGLDVGDAIGFADEGVQCAVDESNGAGDPSRFADEEDEEVQLQLQHAIAISLLDLHPTPTFSALPFPPMNGSLPVPLSLPSPQASVTQTSRITTGSSDENADASRAHICSRRCGCSNRISKM